MQLLSAPAPGPLALRNPVVYLPFFTAYADGDGMVTEQLLNHYARLAGTGVGLVTVEAAAVRDKIVPPFTLHAFGEDALPGLTRLAEVIHEQGAKAVIQVCHTGRFAGIAGCFAPSAVPAFDDPDGMPKAMDEADMLSVAEAFAESADLARRAGFDGVELHGGTGYLLASFTSPHSNRRTDGYGGSLVNRARFPLEVCKAVRERVGDFPVGYRVMVREYIEGGLSLEDGVAFSQLVAKALVPAYLSVTAGMHECFAMFARNKQKSPEGFMLPEAEAVKQALPDVAVIAAGQLQTPEMGEHLLASRMADGVGLGRVLFADPNWLRKAAGEDSTPIRTCVQCHVCVRRIGKGKPCFCSRWTEEEKTDYLKDVPPDRAEG